MMSLEFVDIDVGSNGNVLPKTDKIALIDADTIAFTACVNAEVVSQVMPREFYTDKEWEELQPHLFGDEIITSSLDDCQRMAQAKIRKILDMTGCRDVELHFTIGRESFRYTRYPDYKANRVASRAPKLLWEVKQWLCKEYRGYLHTAIEADDAVAYLKRLHPDKYLVCAVDKDVLNSLPGQHFNYYESAKHNIDMKFVEVDEESARLFPYRQAAMGDKSDNIIGLRGIGIKKAEQLIPNGTPDPMAALIAAYANAGVDEGRAILNFALTYMGPEDICKEVLNGYYRFE